MNEKKNILITGVAGFIGSKTAEFLLDSGNKVIGIEPTKYSASIAQKNEIETITKFFNHNLSKLIKNQYKKIRLIIANNVVAHVDDINNFIQGIDEICNEETIISIEFQYVLSLIQKNQFDTIYHEHFSYYSLISFKNLIKRH